MNFLRKHVCIVMITHCCLNVERRRSRIFRRGPGPCFIFSSFLLYATIYIRQCPKHVHKLLIFHIMSSSTCTTNSNGSECPICMDDINTDTCFFITSCGHMFHMNCFERVWMHSRDDWKIKLCCPLCNATVCKNYYNPILKQVYDEVFDILQTSQMHNAVLTRTAFAPHYVGLWYLLTFLAIVSFITMLFLISTNHSNS